MASEAIAPPTDCTIGANMSWNSLQLRLRYGWSRVRTQEQNTKVFSLQKRVDHEDSSHPERLTLTQTRSQATVLRPELHNNPYDYQEVGGEDERRANDCYRDP